MTLLIVAAILLGLAIFPLGFSAVYREETPGVWLLIGPLRFRVFPGKPKENKVSGNRYTGNKKTSKPNNGSKKGGNYRDFQPVIRSVMEFLGHFRRKIRVNRLELKLTLAGDDPGDLAVNYGRAWGALGSLIPQLERLFVIKNRDIEVLCDFTSDKTLIFARLDATITLGRTLHLLSWHGVKILKHLFKLKKLRKGGVQL